MPIAIGQSTVQDPQIAVQEILAQVLQSHMEFVLFFCSGSYDLEALQEHLHRAFGNVPVIGCTSAGELGPQGYQVGGISAASFSSADFTFKFTALTASQIQDNTALHATLQNLHARMGALCSPFAFLLADGLSCQEEVLSQACQREFAEIPIVGGSAGDDDRFQTTYVYHNGAFHSGQALVAAVSTSLAIKPFHTHPFFGFGAPMVVTLAEAASRTIKEINGRPASLEYAAALGLSPGALTSAHLANAPFVVRINGVDFVRSIKSVHADGSMTLFCAIGSGVVLRLGRKSDLLENRRALANSLQGALGEVESILGFECLQNRQESIRCEQMDSIDGVYKTHRLFGFTTYGEQFQGLHMNQTLTGIAFGRARKVLEKTVESCTHDELQGEIVRLNKIICSLIASNEAQHDSQSSSFGIFQKNALLETEVHSRTAALNHAIAELESVNKSLVSTKVKSQMLFDLLPTPVIVSKLKDGTWTDVNTRFCEVFGYQKACLLDPQQHGLKFDFWSSAQDHAEFVAKVLKAGGALQGQEHLFRNADGTLLSYMVSARILAIENEDHLIIEFQDVSDYAQRISLLRDLSERDALTSLPNRLLILDRLQQAVKLLRRNGHIMAVAYMDLDGFKAINDRHGHKAGDLVLKETALRLQACVRSSDTVGRLGGDEFVLLLLEPESVRACETILARIITAMNTPFAIAEQGSCRVGASIGYTVFPEDHAEPAELLEHADQALYAVKRSGKNHFLRYYATANP